MQRAAWRARRTQIKQAIKNTACSDAAASPWELTLHADLHDARSRSPAGLRSQPHEFNKIIKYLSAPVALLSVHASFKNFADNRVAEIAFADASLRGKLRKVGLSF
jgi:hypothetical protein